MATDRSVIIDVETTGFSLDRGDRVIEVGAVAFENDVEVSEFSSLIAADRKIPRQAQMVHGISDEMLIGQPTPDMVFTRFRDFIAGAIIVGHNVRFDVGFVRHELGRLGFSFNNRIICTLEMSRRRFPHLPNHRLETVALYLLGELPPDCRLHRALGDARLTARVWMAMKNRG